MKGYVYSLATTMVNFDPVDLPEGADTKVSFNRVDGLKRLAAAHNGQGISPEEMGTMIEIRRKINAAVAANMKEVILDSSEADFLRARLSYYRFTVPHEEIDNWCKEIKTPREIEVELTPK